ncbi:hypothetical protein CBR_g31966 [Chara braunii]|uniref:Reverse transcriptase domain-containing protein n=1 Tax=Chara braunii TaxID=69332 RepID=A0A388LG76_CHABU|nr:hypothetical protein CBR_g31966 [Chara braunii]|eukprot:GBG81291.1 hypothetical protein CBR_g31966 [Chara braunii]
MTHGAITVLFKKGDKSNVSLLNVAYNILAKSLVCRLSKHLPGLVERDQGAFVQGRSILNNILTVIETLEIVQIEALDMAILLLDVEKVYDKVGWTFVLTTLKKMGFRTAFCSWIKAMYTFSSSVVMINGHLSTLFQLSRSLRQWCPHAPLVFVLQLEVLLNWIRRKLDIRGLQLHNGEECRVKAFGSLDQLEEIHLSAAYPLHTQCGMGDETGGKGRRGEIPWSANQPPIGGVDTRLAAAAEHYGKARVVGNGAAFVLDREGTGGQCSVALNFVVHDHGERTGSWGGKSDQEAGGEIHMETTGTVSRGLYLQSGL